MADLTQRLELEAREHEVTTLLASIAISQKRQADALDQLSYSINRIRDLVENRRL